MTIMTWHQDDSNSNDQNDPLRCYDSMIMYDSPCAETIRFWFQKEPLREKWEMIRRVVQSMAIMAIMATNIQGGLLNPQGLGSWLFQALGELGVLGVVQHCIVTCCVYLIFHASRAWFIDAAYAVLRMSMNQLWIVTCLQRFFLDLLRQISKPFETIRLWPACGQAVFSKHPQQVGWTGVLGQSWENHYVSFLFKLWSLQLLHVLFVFSNYF